MLEPGALVAGKLRIERILGEGGMGTVAVATHVGLDQRVAIKVLKPELANQPEIVQRFVREARAAAKLKSEHVCRVTDVGETAQGEVYIEMELLEGEDLASRISRGALEVAVAADYVVQACVAIAEAHHLGIVHRDLKPANLFVTQRLDGTALIKVLDFGIATAPSAEDFKITKTSTVMGSPGYMSPEHLRSARDVDVRSDIWALGVILYEAVTGKLPFSATSITELAVKVVMDEPEKLDHIDPRYAAIVSRCLKKPPEERYQTVAELAAELGDLAGTSAQSTAHLVAKLLGGSPSRSVSAATPAVSALAATVATKPPDAKVSTTLSSAASASFAPSEPAPKKQRGLALAIGAVAVIAAGAGAVALVGRSGNEKPAVHAPHPHDAGTPQVSYAPPVDAAPRIDPQLRDKLKELADNKDYQGILVFADAGQSDPQVAAIVADAKAKYVDEQTKEVARHAARGECAQATLEAGEGAKLVPDAADAFTKAATCTAKPKPAGSPTATADQAGAAYAKGDYSAALATAKQVLAKQPQDVTALGIATRAACALHDATEAKAYFAKLPPSERGGPSSKCREAGIDVKATLDKQTQNDVHEAQTAGSSHDWARAEADARKALALEPRSRNGLYELGVALCHEHKTADLDDLMSRVGPLVAARIRRSCGGKAE